MTLHSVGESTQFKNLWIHKDYYFTEELIEECLHNCADSEYVCPFVDRNWTLHDIDLSDDGEGIESNYYEEVTKEILEPAMTSPDTVYSRSSSIQLEDSTATFTVPISE